MGKKPKQTKKNSKKTKAKADKGKKKSKEGINTTELTAPWRICWCSTWDTGSDASIHVSNWLPDTLTANIVVLEIRRRLKLRPTACGWNFLSVGDIHNSVA